MADYWHLWLGALFLKREAYEYQRDRKDSFAHGLFFIVLLGVLVGLASIAGGALRYASGPNAEAVKNVVLTHLQAMPFYAQSIEPSPQAESQFLSGYNQTWALFGSVFMGYPTNAADWTRTLLSVITNPLALIIGWLLYGVLAHLLALRTRPHASLSRGLGTLALATSAQALNIVLVFPGAGVSVVALGLWTLVMNVVALRTAYQLSTRSAILAAVFPLILLLLILILLLCIGLAILNVVVRGGRP